MKPNNALIVEQTRDETGAQAMARKLLEPQLRHALSASAYAAKVLGRDIEAPGIMDFVSHLHTITGKSEAGDLDIVSRLLVSQAITLDTMFTELSRRAALNMGEFINAAESFGRLALKAQNNCRATLETLAKLHQPREQTVRHVHVNDGGQAVIADEFYHHPGGQENAKTIDQSHATEPVGLGSALLGANPSRNGVPVASHAGPEAMPYARRNKSGGT